MTGHRHDYERVFVRSGGESFVHLVKRCKVCGRIGDVRMSTALREPPEGMPVYAASWRELWRGNKLPEEWRVE